MKRGYTKAVAIQHVEKQNGCGKIHKTPQYEIDDYVLYTCPCKYADYGLINNLLNLAEAFNKGILPESGGYLDQNGKNLDAIFLVNSLLDNYKYEQELEQQKKLKHRK
jgi:isoleucyl-tRNA synthetase